MTNARESYAITITATNCAAATGMSWKWLRAFARKHGVPVWHLSAKPVIPAAQLLAAMQAAAATTVPDSVRSFDDEVAAEMADFARELVISRVPK